MPSRSSSIETPIPSTFDYNFNSNIAAFRPPPPPSYPLCPIIHLPAGGPIRRHTHTHTQSLGRNGTLTMIMRGVKLKTFSWCSVTTTMANIHLLTEQTRSRWISDEHISIKIRPVIGHKLSSPSPSKKLLLDYSGERRAPGWGAFSQLSINLNLLQSDLRIITTIDDDATIFNIHTLPPDPSSFVVAECPVYGGAFRCRCPPPSTKTVSTNFVIRARTRTREQETEREEKITITIPFQQLNVRRFLHILNIITRNLSARKRELLLLYYAIWIIRSDIISRQQWIRIRVWMGAGALII